MLEDIVKFKNRNCSIWKIAGTTFVQLRARKFRILNPKEITNPMPTFGWGGGFLRLAFYKEPIVRYEDRLVACWDTLTNVLETKTIAGRIGLFPHQLEILELAYLYVTGD
jgi:hypothetical protein